MVTSTTRTLWMETDANKVSHILSASETFVAGVLGSRQGQLQPSITVEPKLNQSLPEPTLPALNQSQDQKFTTVLGMVDPVTRQS